MKEKNAKINKVTFKQRIDDYKQDPVSMIILILVLTASVITVLIIGFLIAYILIKGIPNIHMSLFELKYTRDNVSMMPAIINTLIMTIVTLIMAVPIGVFSAIYLVEYAKRGSKFVKLIRITTETLSGIPSIVSAKTYPFSLNSL